MNMLKFSILRFSAWLPLKEANGNTTMGEISKFSRLNLAYEVQNFTGSLFKFDHVPFLV